MKLGPLDRLPLKIGFLILGHQFDGTQSIQYIMKKMNRKTFLKGAVTTAIGLPLTLQACGAETASSDAPNVITNKKFRWNMVTTWPPNFPILGEGANLFAKWVEALSAGRLTIKVYGGGELVPALEAFDAVSSGTAEIASGVSYYWAGKAAAAQFFASVPFGMNAQQVNSWIISGGGMELWKELYAGFNLVPMLAGNTGVQTGGWFNKAINTIDDLKGLKMRIPGLGGKVLEKAGGSAVLSAGGEIYTNLERGVIDATEWIGPFHDYKMGFHKIAKYCYYPGWHEPGTALELFANKAKLESLPVDLQQIVAFAAEKLNIWVLAEFEAKNGEYLQKLIQEEQADFRPYPAEVLAQLRVYTEEVLAEITAADAFSKKVYDSYQAFRKQIIPWSEITEKVFYQNLQNG